jgi:hypothetical protein
VKYHGHVGRLQHTAHQPAGELIGCAVLGALATGNSGSLTVCRKNMIPPAHRAQAPQENNPQPKNVSNGIAYAGSDGAISDTSWTTWSSGYTPAISIGQSGDYGVTTTGGGYGYAWQTRDPSFAGIGGYVVAFEFVPAPEPTTLALTGLGALGCVMLFWHRKS